MRFVTQSRHTLCLEDSGRSRLAFRLLDGVVSLDSHCIKAIPVEIKAPGRELLVGQVEMPL